MLRFFNSFSQWKGSAWADPLYIGAELMTANTDVFNACQTTNLAKQFSIRANSWSGVLDLASTIAIGWLQKYTKTTANGGTTSELYNAWEQLFKANSSCKDTARGLGETIKFTFSYEVLP